MYATPAVDKNGNKIALDFPCYGDGSAPIGPEGCGLTLWYSHDSEPEGPDKTFQRYASCDSRHTWMFTGSATEANPIDIDGGALGQLEDNTKGLKFFKKETPESVILIQVSQRRA